MRTVALAAASGIGFALAVVARTTWRVPVFGDVEALEPWLLSTIPSGWSVAGAVLGGLGLGIAAERRGATELLSPFLLPGLGVAVLFPGVFRTAPFLAGLSGRLLDLLLVVACGLALWRLLERRGFAARGASGIAVALVGFALYFAVGSKMLRDVGPSGDEPHYLLVAHSLLEDGDLAVENNYREEDYRQFYNGKIGPHLASGSPYSVHGVGLPLLIAPGFTFLGLRGVLLTEAILAALLLREVFLLAFALTSSRAAALLGASALGLTAPGLFLSVSTYPELPAALAVAAVARRGLGAAPMRARPALLWAIGVGALPFFHVKFLPLTGVLWGVLALRARKEGTSPLAAVGTGAAAALLALLVFFQATVGTPNPTASYGRQRIFVERVPAGVAGLLFDQEFGLLPSSPVYLLGLVGVVSLGRRSVLAAALVVLVLGSVLLPGAAHPLWSGGSSPPARFLFPALPLLAVAAASAFAERPRRGIAPWAPALLLASVGLAGAMALLPGQPLYLNARDGTGRIWEALSSSWDVTAYLPSIVVADARSVTMVVVLFAALALAVALSARGRLALRAPSLALLLLGAAWAQDLAKASPAPAFEARWALRVFRALSDRASERFVALPSRRPLSAADVAERVTLPLDALEGDADLRHWWSRPYQLPAGGFRAEGVSADGAAFANGSGCFAAGGLAFRTRAGLSQFRLRARRVLKTPRLRLLHPEPAPFNAVHTVSLPDGSLLHGLDDEAYLDPRGFWIRGSSTAAFALEPADTCPDGCRLEITNGSVPNVVEVASATGTDRFRMGPGEVREIAIASAAELVRFTVRSERGFRPSDIEPSSRDRRELGVFLPAPARCPSDRR